MTDEPLEEPAEAESETPAKAVEERAEAEGDTPAQPVEDAEDDLQPTTDPQALKPILEALIFASPDPLTLKEMAQLLVAEASKAEVEQALALLRNDYEGRGGLQLVEVAGGYQIVTRPELHEWVRRLFHERTTTKLSVASLETLAVVAYKQPVSRARVSAIRGVNVDGVMRTLVARGLVQEAGQDSETTATLYRTTSYFLERIGITSLEDLPELAPYLPEMADLEDLESSESA
jgi:segregation and condensation protein B